MSDSAPPARPRQLTMAAGFVIGGSVLLVLSIFDTISGLRTVEMREEITKVVTSPTGKGLGLSVEETLSAMRVGLFIAAACAAAAAVLGVYALQRHRAARVALTVLAVPILLTAPLTGGLIGALVAAASLALWSGQARDWFAGRPIREVGPLIAPRETPRAGSQGRGPWEQTLPPPEDRTAPPAEGQGDAPSDVPAVSSLTTSGSSTAPGATSGFGAPPAHTSAQRAGEAPQGWSPPPYAAMADGNAVPITVKVACLLTWVFSGVVALLYAGMLVALVAAQDRIVDYVVDQPAWQRSDLDPSALVPVLWIGCLMFLGWAVGACVLAWFTWRRHNWARWTLVASAGATLVAALFAFPIGLLHQVAALLTISGLLSAGARAWFSPRPWAPGPPPPGPGLPHQGPDPSSQLPPPPPPRPADSSGQGSSSTGGRPPVW